MKRRDDKKQSRSHFSVCAELVPYVVDKIDEVAYFHACLAKACGVDVYPTAKRLADEYFWMRHRGEMRGASGIRLRSYNGPSGSSSDDLALIKRIATDGFISGVTPIYTHAYERTETFTDRQRQLQLRRRGRWVEFVLLCDRSTSIRIQHTSENASAASSSDEEADPEEQRALLSATSNEILLGLPPLVSFPGVGAAEHLDSQEQRLLEEEVGGRLAFCLQPQDWVPAVALNAMAANTQKP